MTETVHNRLERYFTQAAPRYVISAYLFGAYAEQRPHRESDVDVGVLLDWSLSADARFSARVDLSASLIQALHHNDVDVVILNDAPPELGRRIVTRGQRVYCVDAETDHAFVRDVQLRAADLAPFLDRMRRIKWEALRR